MLSTRHRKKNYNNYHAHWKISGKRWSMPRYWTKGLHRWSSPFARNTRRWKSSLLDVALWETPSKSLVMSLCPYQRKARLRGTCKTRNTISNSKGFNGMSSQKMESMSWKIENIKNNRYTMTPSYSHRGNDFVFVLSIHVAYTLRRNSRSRTWWIGSQTRDGDAMMHAISRREDRDFSMLQCWIYTPFALH